MYHSRVVQDLVEGVLGVLGCHAWQLARFDDQAQQEDGLRDITAHEINAGAKSPKDRWWSAKRRAIFSGLVPVPPLSGTMSMRRLIGNLALRIRRSTIHPSSLPSSLTFRNVYSLRGFFV